MAELAIDIIRAQLVGCQVGGDLRYFPVVDSTNRVAADLPAGDWSSGTVVLTDYQSAGRGRSGRTWVAPPDSSVMMSVIFRRERSISPTDYVMMMALAARDALVQITHLDVRLKWPNDVLIADRKVAGILGETSNQQGIDRLILGIGVNVNFAGIEEGALPAAASSLDAETGRSISREAVAARLIRCLDLWYRGFTHRPDEVFDAWAGALDTVGLPLSVQDSGTTWNGIALGVQRDGGLLVETTDGSVRCFYAGDVSVRHSEGFTAR